MPKVKFVFYKERDLDNIWRTANLGLSYGYDFKQYLSPDIISMCRGKTFEECKGKLAKRIQKTQSSGMVSNLLKAVNDSWKEINDEYFKRLKRVMTKPIYADSFKAYMTSIDRCPYNPEEGSFMFSFFSGIPKIMETAGHEIMHLQFHHTYWPKIEDKIGREKTSDLKEALTVLLNLEFKDLWFFQDRGYDIHRELRKYITEQWKKKKDFDVLMKKCVSYLKKNESR